MIDDEVRLDMIGRRYHKDHSRSELIELLEFEPEKNLGPVQLARYLMEYAEEVFDEYVELTEEEYQLYLAATPVDDEYNYLKRDCKTW